MPLVTSEYVEINLIGVILLLTMLFSVMGKYEKSEEHSRFISMIFMNILILLADIGICLMKYHGTRNQILLNHVFCVVYFILHSWFVYEWAQYVIMRLYPRHQSGMIRKILFLLPSVINSVLAALTPFTGWIYTISDTNVYQRGPFIWLPFLMALFYWVVSLFVVLREWIHPSRGREKGEYSTLIIFPIPVLIGNLLQMRFYGLSIVWVCSAISLLILFIHIQNGQLSRDKLTGLYNRGQTSIQLQWESDHIRTMTDLLFAVMFDLDNFKKINDTYGHLSGDKALCHIAEVLKQNCRKSDFISRYGGDEFLLIGHVRHVQEIDAIISRIDDALKEINRTEQLPFTLSVSAGYDFCCQEDNVTVDSLLNAADAKMYEAKRRKKQGLQTDTEVCAG